MALIIGLFAQSTPLIQAFDYIQLLAFTVFIYKGSPLLVQKLLLILYAAFDFQFLSQPLKADYYMNASSGFAAWGKNSLFLINS
jgi:hypothetical protein